MSSTPGPPPLPVAWDYAGAHEVMTRRVQDIVARAVLGVPGVAALSRPHRLLRREPGEAVEVEVGEREVTVTVSLAVCHEAIIPDLAAELRRRVTRAVGQGTGYRVRALSVTIETILPPEPWRQRAERSRPTADGSRQ